MWSQTAVIQKKPLGKLRTLDSITREHRSQRDGHDGHVSLRKTKIYVLRSIY